MDYQRLKKEIKEIAEIAGALPEPFKEKCFEILLNNFLTCSRVKIKGKETKPDEEKQKRDSESQDIPIPSQARVFMQRTGITIDQLKKLLIYEDNDIHFIKEPEHGTVAKGQIEWALLLALKNGLLKNSFETDPEDVRSVCQDKGFYDRANFTAIFKRSTNAKFFKKLLKPQGDPQSLTNAGQIELAKVIKQLVGATE